MSLTDLELCKRIAEIEGVKFFESCSQNQAGVVSIIFNYNPPTNKALLFDLMVKHGVVVKPSIDGFTDVFIDDYKIHVSCAASDEIPRAILECIVESKSK